MLWRIQISLDDVLQSTEIIRSFAVQPLFAWIGGGLNASSNSILNWLNCWNIMNYRYIIQYFNIRLLQMRILLMNRIIPVYLEGISIVTISAHTFQCYTSWFSNGGRLGAIWKPRSVSPESVSSLFQNKFIYK